MADRLTLVTGATGQVGRLVVDELLRAGAPVRALTRRPAHASLPTGVEVVTGDFADPSSLEQALRGVSRVFLVWTAPTAFAEATVARIASHEPAMRRRVVFLSAPIHTPHPFFQQPNPMRDVHLHVERLLAAADLDVAIVRPGMFMANALHWWAPQIRVGNVVRWPCADAETAPIDVRDVAAVAARLLLDDRHARGDYVLTGAESLTQAAQVEAIGTALGRVLRYEEMSPDEFRRTTAAAWPAAVVDMLLAAWQAARGRSAFVSTDLQDILGAPPRTLAEWAADHASAFARTSTEQMLDSLSSP